MNLFVAIGMNQDTVLCLVCAPQCPIDNMVVVPPCHLRDRLVTDRADAALFLPEVRQPTSPTQGLFHLYTKPCFKQDGTGKNDCERNAAKRFIAKLRKDHPHLKFIA